MEIPEWYMVERRPGETVTLRDGTKGTVRCLSECLGTSTCTHVCRSGGKRVIVEQPKVEHDACANNVFDGNLSMKDFVRAYCVSMEVIAADGHSVHDCYRACKLYPEHCGGLRLPKEFDAEVLFRLVPIGYFPVSGTMEIGGLVHDLISDSRFPHELLEIEREGF